MSNVLPKLLPCKICGEIPVVKLSYTHTGLYENAWISHGCLTKVRVTIDIDMGTPCEVMETWNKLMGANE